MERLLEECKVSLVSLEAALDGYEASLPALRRLAAYYDGGDWRRDFEADEAGLLPDGLKRGILSEDALYDLLTEQQEIRARMRELSGGCRDD